MNRRSFFGFAFLAMFCVSCVVPSLGDEPGKAEGNTEKNVRLSWHEIDIQELRKAVVGWDSAESGAPCLETEKRHSKNCLAALQIALSFGELPLGTYTYTKPSENIVHSFYVDKVTKSIDFEFTKEHQTLIRYLSVEQGESWQSEDFIGVDPKRPYGDSSYFQLDMAKHLGLTTTTNEEGFKEIDQATEDRLTDLHHEMQVALQIYLQNFLIVDGTFEGNPFYGTWKRVDSKTNPEN